MRIVINEDESLCETEIIINCKRADENVMRLVSSLKASDGKLTGIKDNRTWIIDADQALYMDTVDKRCFIYTVGEVYETNLKLYELEEKLEGGGFFRSSKSTIINISKIKTITPDFGGRLEIMLTNGEKMIVSRQYARLLKEKLGLKGV